MQPLRGYQSHAINSLRDALRVGRKQVLQLPTGSGKSLLSAHIVKVVWSGYKRAIFVCDRIELISQISKVFDESKIPHGVIQADHERHDPAERVQVCSIQTLKNRKTPEFDVCIIDEVHTLHEAHKRLIEDCPNAVFIGLSATPFTKGLGKVFNGLVVGVTTSDLIERGYLVPSKVFGPSTVDVSKIRTVAGDFDQKQLGEVSDQPEIIANVVDTWVKRGEGRQTICFAVNRAHSRHVVRGFQRRGIKAEHIDAYTPKNERRTTLDAFANGEIKIVSSVDILTKGYDNPSASCLIQACATKSLIKHIQQIGRVLRPFKGKDNAIILDHGGNHERLGFCTDELPNWLDDGTKAANGTKKTEREAQLPKACPNCDFIKPAGERKCRLCGLTPEFIEDVETSDGDLQELKERKKSRKEYSLEQKRGFLGGLNTHCSEHGIKRGWAIHKYKEKFGCVPSSKLDWWYKCPINSDVKGWIQHVNIKHANRRQA